MEQAGKITHKLTGAVRVQRSEVECLVIFALQLKEEDNVKRKEIMDNCPDDFEDEMKDILDYFEGKFGDIRDQLDISDISQLDRVEDAYSLAKDVAEDLY